MLQRYFTTLLFFLLFAANAGAQSIEFIRNEGQWDGLFRYKAITEHGDAYLAENNFTYVLGDAANGYKRDEAHHGLNKDVSLRYHAYRVHFEGASTPEIVSGKEQSWYYNYFFGNDPKRWHSGIHPALALDYKSLYPGVDMHVASQGGNLKYEFVVASGTNPDVIRLRFEGADGLRIKDKNLLISTSVGEAQELKPVAFQYTNDGGRKEIRCQYHLKDNVVSYSFPDGFDKELPLVIDPVVVFATFTGSTADNWGATATYDKSGNFYGGGTCASTGFPVSTGAFQTFYAGPPVSSRPGDIAIIKYNPTGTARIWATYLGGANLDQPHSMIVDTGNNLIIAGRTYSNDYPTVSGCYDVTHNGDADIIVTKINSSGTALVGSTYIGGSGQDGVNIYSDLITFGSLKYNYGDDARSEVIVDNTGNVYVAAATSSADFPVTANASQPTKKGKQDAVFIKLNPNLTQLIHSTFLGGSNDDAAYVLALNKAQTHVYVAGGTGSSDFPSTTGTWRTTYQGDTADGFIARFSNSGTYALQKMSFIGTSKYDQVYGVQVDANDNVYAMGHSIGGTFPVTSGVYSNAGSCQFVIKMDSLLATNIYSTVFGSGSSTTTNISPVAFLVDSCENVYISGWGGNLGITSLPGSVGTTNGMPVTAAAIPAGSVLSATTDGYDFYFIVLAKNAASLLFGAFYGRNSTVPFYGEHVDGGTSRFDKAGVIYQAICGGCGGSSSPALPTTSGSFSPTNGSNTNCNLASLKIAFQLSIPDAIANASPKASGCAPLTVQFANSSTNAISYQWNFADGSPIDTNFQPKHTFTKPGNYNVQLIVYNPNACKTRDTTYLTITVDNNSVKSDFNYTVTDSCGPYRATFVNNSTYSPLPGSIARTSFTWYFGDGTSFNGTTPPAHNFPGTGIYTVMLVMKDTAACNNPDTIKKVVNISSNRVKAQFTSPDSVCLYSELVFTNQSSNATGITWYFGDGDTSKSTAPVAHTYKSSGDYTVKLVAVNPFSCNKTDTLSKTIRIKKLPIANFTHAPIIPISNTPVTFTNKSLNADNYLWDFGDNSAKSTEVNPVHLYRRTGSFTACLKVTTLEGCADSICKTVESDVHTAIDIPTGFSPNGDGSNDILYVRGGGIETMNLKIFNRWGQKVFESNSLSHGWDGKFNGKAQEMDAYGYVLTATFIDGSSTTKKGNITLLR